MQPDLEFKTAAVATPGAPVLADDETGIVEAYVAVTGVKDEVGDIITPGAFARTLAKRRPKVCLGHDWNRPIGKVLDIKELLPGDPALPKETWDGKPWPKQAGVLWSRTKYNLDDPDGLAAYKAAKFFENETKFSIGYKAVKTRRKLGARHLDDMDLFEYSQVLHGANVLAALGSVKDGQPGSLEMKARRYVRDATYWGYPVGTLITAAMKPRGRAALKLRKEGRVPDKNVGVDATDKPEATRVKPGQRDRERDEAGLFPEPEAPEGTRVQATAPRGEDDQYLGNLVEAEEPDASDAEPGDRDEDMNGLLAEGITPAELEEDLRSHDRWHVGLSEEDRDERIADLVEDYRTRYRALAKRQARRARGEDEEPEGAKPEVGLDDPDTATRQIQAIGDSDPEAVNEILTALDDDDLRIAERELREADADSPGAKAAKAELDRREADQRARQEEADREDAAIRAEETARRRAEESAAAEKRKADEQTATEYRAEQEAVLERRSRAQDIANARERNAKINEQIDASQTIAAEAPETLTTPGALDEPAGGDRIKLHKAGQSNWQLRSNSDTLIVSAAAFRQPGSNRKPSINKTKQRELADRIAAITNAEGNKAPFTYVGDDKDWAAGFRDAQGNDFGQAAAKVMANWAQENGLELQPRYAQLAQEKPRGRPVDPGVPDADGFYPREQFRYVSAGDEVRLPDGSTHTVQSYLGPVTGRRTGYSYTVGIPKPGVLTFTDGSTHEFAEESYRVDVRYAQGDPSTRLQDPGMGYIKGRELGRPAAEYEKRWQPDIERDLAGSPESGTRFIYTQGTEGYLGEFNDDRPRLGTVTDRVTSEQGKWFNVVEYDDGTTDALHVGKLVKSGKVKLNPTPEEEAEARRSWGLGESDAAPEEPEPTPDDSEQPEPAQPEPEAEEQPEAEEAASKPAKLMEVGDRYTSPVSGATVEVTAFERVSGNRIRLNGQSERGPEMNVFGEDDELTIPPARLTPPELEEPEGGIGDGEAVITRPELDEAEAIADEMMGITEDPDGELEVEPEIAERQDRVIDLLARAEGGALDLAAADDLAVGSQRRDLVDELRLQEAVARRDRRRRNEPQPGRELEQPEGEEGGAREREMRPKPTGRPGLAGAAEDLADAVEGDGDSAAAVARMETSLRRSRSDSVHVRELREAIERGGGLQGAIDAGEVTPETLRTFATSLREERRARANERARDRRKLRRLERERLRSLIGEYDTELRRRNLKPESFGGPVPESSGDGGVTPPEQIEPEPPPPPAVETVEEDGEVAAGPNAERGQQLAREPHRLVDLQDPAVNEREAARLAFGPMAREYAATLSQASNEEMANAARAVTLRGGDPDGNDSLMVAMLLDPIQRLKFLGKLREAVNNYKATLVSLRERERLGEIQTTDAPELATAAPGRVGWGNRLNALAPRPRGQQPVGEPQFTDVAAVTSHLKSMNPPGELADYQRQIWESGRNDLIRMIDAADGDAYLSPGGGLLAFRGDTKSGKRWFLIHTLSGGNVPKLITSGFSSQQEVGVDTERNFEAFRYDLDGPAMRRMMTALELIQDPRGRQVDWNAPDAITLRESAQAWRDYSADGTWHPGIVEGSVRYGDNIEAAAIAEAVASDPQRYASTHAVTRATGALWRHGGTGEGFNRRTGVQLAQLMREQFPFVVQDFNYGRKRERGSGPIEDRTKEQLKQDKATTNAVKLAELYVSTNNPVDAVRVLLQRAREMRDGADDRSPRFGPRRLEGLANDIAELFSPGEPELDRLLRAQEGDYLAQVGGDVGRRATDEDREIPRVWKIVSPPRKTLTRPDGTAIYQASVLDPDGEERDLEIDTGSRNMITIGRFGEGGIDRLYADPSGSWAVFRADDDQPPPVSNDEASEASWRGVREFMLASGLADLLESDDEEGPPDPSEGTDVPGQRTVPAEGKAIAIEDVQTGDLVALPGSDGEAPFIGHVIEITNDESDRSRVFSMTAADGTVRVLPMNRQGAIYRIDHTDPEVLAQIPDWTTSARVNVGGVPDLGLLPVGTPVLARSGGTTDYRVLASGIVARMPDGQPAVRTVDGRLLSRNALYEQDYQARLDVAHSVADEIPGDYTGENRKVSVSVGDRVEAYVTIEDPASASGLRGSWIKGWVETTSPGLRPTRDALPPSLTIRTASGAVHHLYPRSEDTSKSRKLRRKGGPTKQTRAAVARVRAAQPTHGQRLVAQMEELERGVRSQISDKIEQADTDRAPQILRAEADKLATAEVSVDRGSARIDGLDEVRAPVSLAALFGGHDDPDDAQMGEVSDAAWRQAAIFSRDYAVRLMRMTADSMEEVRPVERRHRNRIARMVAESNGLRGRALDELSRKHAEAIAKRDANLSDDGAAFDAAEREKIAVAVRAAWREAFGLAVDMRHADALPEGDPADVRGRIFPFAYRLRVSDDLAPIKTLLPDAQYQVIQSALVDEVLEQSIVAARKLSPRALRERRYNYTAPGEVIDSIAQNVLTRRSAGADQTQPYVQRVQALRAQLSSSPIGRDIDTFRVNGDALTGELELVQSRGVRRDMAADGGPGPHAMRQLALLRSIGSEIRQEAARILEPRRAEIDAKFDAEQAELDARSDELANAKAEYDAAWETLKERAAQRVQQITSLGSEDRRALTARLTLLAALSEESYEQRKGMIERYGHAATEALRDLREANWPTIKPLKEASDENIKIHMRKNSLQERWMTEVRDATAAARREALAAVRELGGSPEDLKLTSNLRGEDAEKLAAYRSWTASLMPKDWLDAAVPVTVQNEERRGWMRGRDNLMELGSPKPDVETPIGPHGTTFLHEYGHHMENTLPALSQAEWAFHHDRTSRGALGARRVEELNHIGSGYAQHERTRKDRFRNPYSGKIYDDSPNARSFEVFTMGLEGLFGRADYIDLDPDYEDFMLGTLAGIGLDGHGADEQDGGVSAPTASAAVPDTGAETVDLTDEQYLNRIDSLQDALRQALWEGKATDRTYMSDNGVWEASRADAHKQILDELWARHADVPSEGKAVFSGGLGGAGKSTVLRKFADIDQSQFVVINPDDIKELMAERGMVPVLPGFTEMESSALIHEESSYLSSLLAERAYAANKNILFDITMSRTASVQKRLDNLREHGYTDVQTVFVDIPVETSVERALARHRRGVERHRRGTGRGGRYVSPEIIRENASARWSSANRGVFEELKPQFSSWSVYDNSGTSARLLDNSDRSSEQAKRRLVFLIGEYRRANAPGSEYEDLRDYDESAAEFAQGYGYSTAEVRNLVSRIEQEVQRLIRMRREAEGPDAENTDWEAYVEMARDFAQRYGLSGSQVAGLINQS